MHLRHWYHLTIYSTYTAPSRDFKPAAGALDKCLESCPLTRHNYSRGRKFSTDCARLSESLKQQLYSGSCERNINSAGGAATTASRFQRMQTKASHHRHSFRTLQELFAPAKRHEACTPFPRIPTYSLELTWAVICALTPNRTPRLPPHQQPELCDTSVSVWTLR